MELVDFKYVYCPVLKRELRIKRSYERYSQTEYGRKTLIDCTGARECGALWVADEKVNKNFSGCPFNSIRFIGEARMADPNKVFP